MEDQDISALKDSKITIAQVAQHMNDYSGDCNLLNAFYTPPEIFPGTDFLTVFYKRETNRNVCFDVMELWIENWSTMTLYMSETQELTNSGHEAAYKLAESWANHFKKTVHVAVARKPLVSELHLVVSTV